MAVSITFLGAARTVTGSKYLVETSDRKILVDCGMFQEYKHRDRNWAEFPVPPSSLDAMVLTHAHLDHCGLIPKLVKDGFKGRVYATAATADIAQIVMNDSGKIQEEDIAYKQKRHKKEGRTSPHPYVALYTREDAENVEHQMNAVPFYKEIEVAPGITATYTEAGHILGAACVRLVIEDGGDTKAIQFSGDLGRWGVPIIRDPAPIQPCDFLVTESTYGDRLHKDAVPIPDQLQKVILDTLDRGGNVVVPAFAVERSQELLFHLGTLRRAKRIPPVMSFLDSPMAVRVTDVFRRHRELFDEDTLKRVEKSWDLCDMPGMNLVRSVEQSKAINRIKGTSIILAGSGMCTGGRIKHHIKANINRPESTILFVGYQAEGTLGRYLLSRPETVRIHGQEHNVRAKIEQINGLSGHGDRDDMLRWMEAAGSPRRVFVTHGEAKVADSFAETIHKAKGWATQVPDYQEKVVLD